MGERCREFERQFASYVGIKHAIMVNSGSSANLLATFALANPLCPLEGSRRRIKPGSEVIVPALTWSTTVWPYVQAGAVPVFVDCDPQTLQMQPEAIQAAVTSKTAAIAIVHVLGGAVDVSAVRRIADDQGLWLFEDTCESLGVLWEGRQVGSFGHLASFRFYFAHQITTIEGGMVVTDDDELADLMRAVRAHGWIRHMEQADRYAAQNPEIDPRFLFITTGFNLRPTEINGAIGTIQLTKLDAFNESRRRIGRRLDRGLSELAAEGKLGPMTFDRRCTPAPFGYPVVCRTNEQRNALQRHLEANGVETRPVICGNLARQPALKHFEHRVSGSLAGADRVMDCGLYWGTHPMMSEDEVDYVIDRVKEFYS
jgi:CDP-6-deoxy-D-xylo-4-hexulose-3-dehydrase